MGLGHATQTDRQLLHCADLVVVGASLVLDLLADFGGEVAEALGLVGAGAGGELPEAVQRTLQTTRRRQVRTAPAPMVRCTTRRRRPALRRATRAAAAFNPEGVLTRVPTFGTKSSGRHPPRSRRRSPHNGQSTQYWEGRATSEMTMLVTSTVRIKWPTWHSLRLKLSRSLRESLSSIPSPSIPTSHPLHPSQSPYLGRGA